MSDISNNGNGTKKPIRKISISKKPQKPKAPAIEEVVIEDIVQDAGGEVVPVPEIVPKLDEGEYNNALTMESEAPGDMDSYNVEEFLHFGDSDADEEQYEDQEETSEYDENDDSENYEDYDGYSDDEEYEEYDDEDSEDGSYDSDEYDQYYDDGDDQYDDSDSEENKSEEYYDDDDDDLSDDIPDDEYTAIYDGDDNNNFFDSFDEDESGYNDDGENNEDDKNQSFEVEDLDEDDETENNFVEEEAIPQPRRQPVQVQTLKSNTPTPKRSIRIQQNNRPNNTVNAHSNKVNRLVNSRSSINVGDVPDSPELNFGKPKKEEYQDISSSSNGNPYSINQVLNKTQNDNQIKQDGNSNSSSQPQQPINRHFIRQQQQQPLQQSNTQQIKQPVVNQPIQQQQPQKAAFDDKRSNFDYPSQTVQNKEEKDFLDTINSIFDRFKFFFFIGGFSIICLLIIIMGLLK